MQGLRQVPPGTFRASLSRFVLPQHRHLHEGGGRKRLWGVYMGFLLTQHLHHHLGNECQAHPDPLCIPGREMCNYSSLTDRVSLSLNFRFIFESKLPSCPPLPSLSFQLINHQLFSPALPGPSSFISTNTHLTAGRGHECFLSPGSTLQLFRPLCLWCWSRIQLHFIDWLLRKAKGMIPHGNHFL